MGETPGSIPNPEAKAHSADGTAAGRLWESKSPPTPNNKNNKITLVPRGAKTPIPTVTSPFLLTKQQGFTITPTDTIHPAS